MGLNRPGPDFCVSCLPLLSSFSWCGFHLELAVFSIDQSNVEALLKWEVGLQELISFSSVVYLRISDKRPFEKDSVNLFYHLHS